MTLFVIKETFFESRRVRRIHQLQFKLQEGIRPGIMSVATCSKLKSVDIFESEKNFLSSEMKKSITENNLPLPNGQYFAVSIFHEVEKNLFKPFQRSREKKWSCQ